MKETPPDIDIARELDIFTKAHFPTNDSNDHHHQQQNHAVQSTLSTNYGHQNYHLGRTFAFTTSTSPSSSSSTSFFHPSTVTSSLRSLPAHSIAASNSLIPTHIPPKNPEIQPVYENYSLSYQNTTMTDSTHSHSSSPHSGYTTPTTYSAVPNDNASTEEHQKQQTFDQFMSMMNMVDQRLQQLGHHGNSMPLFSTSTSTSHTSTSSSSSTTTPSIINTIPNASTFSHSGHQPMTSITSSKPAVTNPVVSSSTPTRGGRGGRRKKIMSSSDRKGKQPATAFIATPTASSSYPSTTTTTSVPHHHHQEKNSDSNNSEEDISDLDDDDDRQPGTSDINDRVEYARDKRRRNTEASARFRIKKKIREQALRRTADEMTLRSQHLQQRVHELEKEIKWLRELIVEKRQSHST